MSGFGHFTNRILKELKNLKTDNYELILTDNIYLIFMKFKVPNGLYKDQIHIIELKLKYGSNVEYMYPKNPPKCSIMTPIWHCNIGGNAGYFTEEYLGGNIICLDTLSNNWSAMSSMNNVYLQFIELLNNADPSSPQNPMAGSQCKNSPEEYDELARTYYDKKNGKSTVDHIMLTHNISNVSL